MEITFDTLKNLVAGLFTGKDKSAADRWHFEELDRAALDAAYRGDWIARKIVDAPALDMTRQWRTWRGSKEQVEAMKALEDDFNLQLKVYQAITKARLYGGAALVMGVEQGAPEEALRPDSIKRGALKYIHVMSRWEISAGTRIADIESPWYGEPEEYTITTRAGATQRVHPSRVVRLSGAELPDPNYAPHGWGDSILQSVNDAVHNAALASQGIASLIHEAKVDVIRVPDLMEHLTSEESTNRLTERFTLAATMKSINNTLLLDKEEEWERKQISFSQMPELISTYMQIAAGAADIPATRLLGQAPKGMNATGESDLRNYYDRLKGEQELTVGPAMERLDEVMIRSALGSRPAEVGYEWVSLWQLPEKEQAEIGKLRAETTEKYANTGLIPSQALSKGVVSQLVESGEYPGLEEGMEEFETGAEGFDPEAGDPHEDEPEPEAGSDPQGQEDAAPRIVRMGDSKALVRPRAIPAQDARPRTLYVSRRVLNAEEIAAHFRGQGFASLVEPEDMHVTLIFSRLPVDWFKIGESWAGSGEDGSLTVSPGGPRALEELDGGAAVLEFASNELRWRHERMVELGAHTDREEYRPHITLTYGDAPDLQGVEPWTGKIVLGPEIFEEIIEDWKAKVREG
ncbi:anti-CBASS protein Acb1 family protein [Euryhalocaulis caribicus]|uniref:anti-CBASS protein Acb1 family protein n=1 Tax=Euryhalocaulis caribicus TaxID=1161401 RepID=UPI00039C1E65|nr:anti-CBASS Acb1 family protein [Euryhalocaulis caribicus]